MSTSAVIFLLAAVVCFAGALLLPWGATYTSTTMGSASALFACLFILALVKGRRIKFDPLLR